VQLRSDPLEELAIPDDTTVEEHDLVTDGDVLVGGQSTVEFGVRGANVMAGERVTFGGHIEAEADCRLDMWSEVAQDVLVGRDAYLGERVSIDGELKVAGDLDIGDDVDIAEGFEANGWITVRNPMPTIVFLVVYLSQLLRIGEEEAAEQLAEQLVDGDDSDEQPLVIPRSARVSDETWRVSTPATIGDDCRIHGNIRAQSLDVGSATTVFGSLRAREDVTVGSGTEIKGDVTTRNGDVHVERGAHVWGDISAEDVRLHEHAVVDGRIRVSGELTQIRATLGPERPASEADESDDSGAKADPKTADSAEMDDTEEASEPDDAERTSQKAADSDDSQQEPRDTVETDDSEQETEPVAGGDDAESVQESFAELEFLPEIEERDGEATNGHDDAVLSEVE